MLSVEIRCNGTVFDLKAVDAAAKRIFTFNILANELNNKMLKKVMSSFGIFIFCEKCDRW